ncbi:AraC family transcriptional regulator [Thalassospira marina]|uniref:AraC family transcriptional regulator n=2 Tax=Thalassospira marina TaxID=2048283 RepID=A0A2N3L067_9PROT|nr:AraC family transcriptional regulator [Thalassospira marina]
MPNHMSFRFLLFDGFSNMVLASALEPLRAVRNLSQGPNIGWHICTPENRIARSSSNIQIQPDCPIENPDRYDYLVVIAGYDMRGHVTGRNRAQLRQLAGRARFVVGLDTGAWLLAAAGLLDGAQATIHWQEFADFAETFPEVETSRDRFVFAGKYITSGGASTVLDLMLHLLGQNFGPAMAFDAANLFVYDAERQHRGNRGANILKHRSDVPGFLAAIDVMMDHIENPVSLDFIAGQASLSLRSLDRLFQRELSMSPGKYYQLLRLGRARDLATQTGLPVAQIALQTGFSSPATLSRAFRAQYGTQISTLRAHRKGKATPTD